MGNNESRHMFVGPVIHKLSTSNSEEDIEAFFCEFLDGKVSMDDLNMYSSSQDIKKIRDRNSNLFLYMIEKCIERIKSFFVNGELSSRKTNGEIINCVVMLTKMLPFCFESDELNDKTVKILLPSLDICEDKIWNGMVTAIVDLLFVPGLSLPSYLSNSKIFYVIWEDGVGSSAKLRSYQDIESNRKDIMKLLLVVLTWNLYSTNKDLIVSPFLIILCCKLRNELVLALLSSLLNNLIKFNPSSWRPHLVFQDHKEYISGISAQILILLLDFEPQYYTNNGIDTKSSIDVHMIHNERSLSGLTNRFKDFLPKLYKEKDLKLISSGLLNIISNPLKALRTYFASRQTKIYPEVIIFIWQIIRSNKQFMIFIIESDEMLDLLTILVFYICNTGLDQSTEGLSHIASFILLHLSGEREFSVKLNRKFEHQHLASLTKKEHSQIFTYSDFLIYKFSSLMITNVNKLISIGECLMMTIVNISPFVKCICKLACRFLVDLCKSISLDINLYSTQQYHKTMKILLETFGYIIQYQPDGNLTMISVLLETKDFLKSMEDLTYSVYIQHVHEYNCSATPDNYLCVVSEESFCSIKQSLKVKNVLHVLEQMGTEIERLKKEYPKHLLRDIKNYTFVGVVPLQKQIHIRKIKIGPDIYKWISTYILGIILIHNNNPPLFLGVDIKLFSTKPLCEDCER